MSARVRGLARWGLAKWGLARWTAAGAAGLVLAGFPLLAPRNIYLQNVLIMAFLLAVMASGWNVISGFAGYVSLGQSAFLGIGAYTTGLASLHLHVSPFVMVPAGALAAALTAALLGVVVMRTRGHAFVIITIAFLFLAQLVAVNAVGLTGGSNGLTLPLPSWDRDYQNFPFYYALLALLVLSIAMSARIRRSKLGAGLVAIREDEGKATTVGVNTRVYKVLGFAASAVLIGAAGGVFGYYLSFVDPRGMFDILVSVQIVLAGLLGGRGTVWGPVLGAFLLEPVNEATNAWFGGSQLHLVIFGALLAAAVLFLPAGIVPTVTERLERRRAAAGAAAGLDRATRTTSTAVPPSAPAGAPRPDADLLELRGLAKRFGGLTAVDGCSFAVRAGSVTGLIGPNGSGKTTIFNLVSGTARPDRGEIWFGGRRIDRAQPWERAWLGLGRTFQITRLLAQMTVLENVVAPLRRFSWRQLGADAVSGPEARRAHELLEFVGMHEFAGERAGHLSFGQQKLVELAQVLMLEPRLILLDEPAGGVSPRLVERISELIGELNRRGMTFLIVEHNMPMVLGLCDPVLVLSAGRCIAQGPPKAIQRDPAVLDAYLGRDLAAPHQRLEV